jgi:hypothetical protein
MAEFENPYPSLFVDQKFDTFEEARSKVLDAIARQGHSYKVQAANQQRWCLVCRYGEKYNCQFAVRISRIPKSNQIELRKLVPHSCPPDTHEHWKLSRASKLIAARHEDTIKSDFQMKPNQIQVVERLLNSNKVPYMQAWRARKRVHQDAFLDRASSFQLLYPLLQAITDEDRDIEEDDSVAISRANVTISRDDSDRFQ